MWPAVYWTISKMDCSLGISDSVVSCIVNQKEEVIKMGYLVKSPSKSREKANYAVFWKLRWCVLVRASYADPLLNAEYSQHFLHYFEDKEHFQQSSTAKGTWWFCLKSGWFAQLGLFNVSHTHLHTSMLPKQLWSPGVAKGNCNILSNWIVRSTKGSPVAFLVPLKFPAWRQLPIYCQLDRYRAKRNMNEGLSNPGNFVQ